MAMALLDITTNRPHACGLARGPLEAPRRRLELADVLVDSVDLSTAVERLHALLRCGASHQVVTVNLDFLNIAQRDHTFRETINQAHLAVADGMPLVWLSRLLRQPLPERVAGVELVDESCRLAARAGRGIFLLGAAPGVAEVAGRELEARFPGLRIVGTYSPPFGSMTADEDERIIHLINRASPGFLFVAFGAPRQDLWIRSHLHRLHVPVSIGVGCVLDLLAGRARRAPRWMRRTGLEWSYRLYREPGRLWRRYIVDDVPFLGRLGLRALGSGLAQRPL